MNLAAAVAFHRPARLLRRPEWMDSARIVAEERDGDAVIRVAVVGAWRWLVVECGGEWRAVRRGRWRGAA